MKKNIDLEPKNAAKLPYQLINNLLYFENSERDMRLCIPTKTLKHEVFKLAHNEMRHPGYARTHEKLTRGIYIFNMSTKLHEYLRHCPHCQLHQTPRHSPYKSLQPIYTPSRPFHTITIDFILALSKTDVGLDCYISITEKFNKAITLIANSSSWTETQ